MSSEDDSSHLDVMQYGPRMTEFLVDKTKAITNHPAYDKIVSFC